MRRLTSTLSPTEAADRIGLDPDVVDALLRSGSLLCHLKDGEARIPLSELEAFFREGLLRVYQAVPGEIATSAAVKESAVASPVQEGMPVLPAPSTAEVEEDEEDAVAEVPSPAPVPAAALPDQRRAMRYVPRRQIDGLFDDVRFTILQISRTGLRIRHKEPLMPGSEAKLTFALIKPARSVVVRVRVVWTSLAQSGEERFSISGLRVLAHGDRLQSAVESLLATHDLQPERRERQRRSDDAVTGLLSGASDEEIALVTAAMQKFASDPVEASRWYSRGRFALSDEQVRRAAPPKARDREEVLGLWEYLDRQIELEKIAGVVLASREMRIEN